MKIRFSLLIFLSVMLFTQVDAQTEKPDPPSPIKTTKLNSRTLKKDQSYNKTLQEYLKATGSWETFDGVILQMIELNKNVFPEVETEFWDEFGLELQETGKKELYELLLPIYKEHFTIEDLQAFIAFYETPAGKKLAEKTPALTQESMQAGQEWGRKIGQRISDRIKKKNN